MNGGGISDHDNRNTCHLWGTVQRLYSAFACIYLVVEQIHCYLPNEEVEASQGSVTNPIHQPAGLPAWMGVLPTSSAQVLGVCSLVSLEIIMV